MNRASTIAELLTVLAMLGVGACLLLPNGGIDTAGYGLDVVVGVMAVGAVVGLCISTGAFWRRPILVVGATAVCTAVGAAFGWLLIAQTVWTAGGMVLIGIGWFVYLIIQGGRRAEQ